MGTAEEWLRAQGTGWTPKIAKGRAVVPCRQFGSLVFVSGHGPHDAEGRLQYSGRLGEDLTTEQGYAAARAVGVQLLRSLRDHLGDLDRIEAIVHAFALVNSSTDFIDQPKVVNGFSDLMIEVFGSRGVHSRSAMGTNVLPENQPVEIELIAAVRN